MIDIVRLKRILCETQPKLEFCKKIPDLNGLTMGTNEYSDSDYGNVHIRFYIKNNTLRISHLFLVNKSRGTGTKLINFFIEQAKINNYSKVIITNAKITDEIMRKLCKDFQQEKINDGFVNYIYNLL